MTGISSKIYVVNFNAEGCQIVFCNKHETYSLLTHPKSF